MGKIRAVRRLGHIFSGFRAFRVSSDLGVTLSNGFKMPPTDPADTADAEDNSHLAQASDDSPREKDVS